MEKTSRTSSSLLTAIVAAAFLFFSACSPQQQQQQSQSPQNFKVIGYLFNKKVPINSLPYQYLTHINYSFALPAPDSSGKILPVPMPKRLTKLSQMAHDHGVKVFISVGGWDLGDGGGIDTRYEVLAASPATRTAFVQSAMDIVRKFNLDGVDIDWEYPDPLEPSSSNFVKLMKQLSDSLHAAGKKLSAAIVANSDLHLYGNGLRYGYGIKNKVYQYVDWMNIMAYSYKSSEDIPHSPYWLAVRTFDYWVNKRKLPKSKAMLGLNFGFYQRLIAMGADPYADSYTATVGSFFGNRLPEGAPKDSMITIYYNGIKTIKAKTKLTLKRGGGGIMMWAVAGDTTGQYSLLKAINEVLSNNN